MLFGETVINSRVAINNKPRGYLSGFIIYTFLIKILFFNLTYKEQLNKTRGSAR